MTSLVVHRTHAIRHVTSARSPTSASGIIRIYVFLFLFLCSHVSGLYFRGTSRSHAKMEEWNVCKNASLSFQFRTTQEQGLLAYVDDGGHYDFIEIIHTSGRVKLVMNIVDGIDGHLRIVGGSNINDGRWHSVKVTRNRMQIILAVDGVSDNRIAFGSDYKFGHVVANSTDVHQEASSQQNSSHPVYLGGLPDQWNNHIHSMSLPSSLYQQRFKGDIRNVMYNNCTCATTRVSHVDLVDVSDNPIEQCDISDTCRDGCVCVSEDDRQTSCDCSRRRCVTDLFCGNKSSSQKIRINIGGIKHQHARVML